MFGLLKKSKPLQDDVYFPFKTVVEKKQLIFDKRQFASNEFDFVQKQRKRQNKSNDEKWVRSGDRPFTKAKRSNRVVLDQNELQTYASLEKMLHKAIHAIRQLKRKGNTNTSSAPKHQSEVRLPSRTAQDDRAVYRLDPLTSGMKFRPSPRPEDRSDRTSTRPSQPSRQARVNSRARLDLDHARLDEDYARLDLDHATLDVDHARLNEDHARLDLDHARLDLGGEETEDGQAFSSGGPSGQSHKRPYRYPVHPSGSAEHGHLD
ncbi:hypothetical protein DY000_02018031 [Brassica cretica]|uniref:DUF3741 domain-containing protein n=1 Tax=Brassica cretica TaxID=69181 RepID=A0ABQ7CS06_BRACR|nr:hypothetical protein DY000_02018031 [Brassica cretica]